MRRITMALATLCMSAALLCGCSTSKGAAEATTEAANQAAETAKIFATGLNEDGTMKDVNPEDIVTVCDYKNIELKKKDVTPSDTEVQAQVDQIMATYKTTEQVKDRKVKKDDVVNIDYTGTIDGKEFEGGSATGYDLTIGSGSFIDDFEDQLIGKKPGDDVTVKVTFPEDYQAEKLKGKDAEFKVKINYISVEKEQELTDKFVKKNLKDQYGYTSVKDMKKKIKESIKSSMIKEKVWSYLLDKSKFKEIPEDLVNKSLDVEINMLKQQISSSGYNFEDYLASQGIKSEEALREQYYSQMENTVKLNLIADVIAKKEKLTVQDSDIAELLQTEDFASYVDYYSINYIKRMTLNNMVVNKVMETVKEK